MLKLSAHIGYLFTERPLVDRFLAARDAGFVSVDLSDVVRYPLAEILEGMRRSGLPFRQTTAAAFNADGRGPGLAALPGREVEFRACCAAVLNYFEATGLRWVHLPSGTPAPTIPLARSYATYLDNLRHALEWFEPYRVGVLIEPLNRVDIPCYFLDLPLARRVMAEVGNPNLRILFDVYHVAMEGLDPAQTLRERRADIGHIQIADAPGRHEPGTGNINFAAVMNALAEIGYDNCRPDRGRVGVDEGAAGSAVMRGAHCAARVISIRASALIALTLSIPCPAIPSARARCDRDRGNTFAGR